MSLIDTHAHLYWEFFEKDLVDVVNRSKEAGITIIINSGVDLEKSQEAIFTSKRIANLGIESYAIIGIHPHEVTKYTSPVSIQQDIDKLEQIYLSNKEIVVGIGECGLDYLYDKNYQQQKELFKTQIDLAKKLNLPLIVHCRDDRSQNPQNNQCWTDTLNVVGNYPTVLHCYSGLLPTTNCILQTTNLIVSFAGNITYPKNEYLREAARMLPLKRIILETDSPFLAPQSERGKRNEPQAVKEIAQVIACAKGLSFARVAAQTTANARKIFHLQI